MKRVVLLVIAAALAVGFGAYWLLARMGGDEAGATLCDERAGERDRELAVTQAADAGRLLAWLRRKDCPPSAVWFALPLLDQRFDELCGRDACIDLWGPMAEHSTLARDPAGELIQHHQKAALRAALRDNAALIPVLDEIVGPFLSFQLVAFAADGGAAAAAPHEGDSAEVAAWELMQAIDHAPKAGLADALRVFTEAGGKQGSRAALLLYALDEAQLTAAQEADAIAAVSCSWRAELRPRLHLDEPARAAAVAALAGCGATPAAAEKK